VARPDLEYSKFAADGSGDVTVKVQFVIEGAGTLPANITDREESKFNTSGDVRVVVKP